MSTRIGSTRRVVFCFVGTALVLAVGSRSARAQFVEFTNETDTRIDAPNNLVVNDPEEKDYAWGDVDKDGDTDLIIVRKQPFTSTGKRVNVLLMNEGGVLVDRTDEYATASDVNGDNGFATATNDRDVILVDVDGDGWLDMVTAVTLTDNQAKHMSHPRVYMNLRDDPPDSGIWQGFEYQDDRIPQMHATAGPRFCSVAAGDVTGDGAPDLYFGDYDTGGAPPGGYDYNNRLLINDGNGFFTDESTSRMTSQMLLSAFGAASAIGDMNNDGFMDVVKQTSLNDPRHVAVTYNDPDDEGFFEYYDILSSAAPYFISIGFLNDDDILDIVVVDDGQDRFKIGTGLDGSGRRNYTEHLFPSSTNGFGGNSFIADLNNDGLNDVIITDVDVDIPGCVRSTHILQNMGGTPTFSEDFGIPGNMRTGWHDVAVFDINGDGWLDLVAGRCTSTQVWMNDPPFNIGFDYVVELPVFLQPNEEYTIQLQLSAVGASVDPDTVKMYYSVNGDAFVDVLMTPLGEDLYEAALPALDCLDHVNYYFEARLENGFAFRDPAGAPSNTYSAVAALGTELVFSDDMEGDVSDWAVVNDPLLLSGAWEQADPNGTIHAGSLAAPDNDATPGEGNVMAFVTENCESDEECSSPGNSDVDGGPTYLISPIFDLSGQDATVRYARWFYTSSSQGEDVLITEVSNDGGGSWVMVHATEGTDSSWETAEFVVSEYVTPTANVRFRFIAEDHASNVSFVEAGIDDLEIELLVCEVGVCDEDLDGDGVVGASDLAILLGSWGPCADCPADFDGNGIVDAADLAVLLGSWGACS